MTRYACSNPSCPKREPVTAETAPTCYTCGRTMVIAVPTHDPAHAWFEFGGVHANSEMEEPRSLPPIVVRVTPTGRVLYISLHADVPGGHGDPAELNYPGYRRQFVDRRPDGQWPERIALDFPMGTASCWARSFGISHGEASPVLWISEIHPHIYIDSVVIPRLILNSLGSLEITEA
jgi:hypothetical protein